MATAPLKDALAHYRAKRDFAVSREPRGGGEVTAAQRWFVVQKHHARRLHYDLRLELDGVMLSWAVPKGPSLDPRDKRMAIHVEDHPIAYRSFEGTIPPGQYGAGTVIVWDHGHWEPLADPHAGLLSGKLMFTLHGHKLCGLWELVRIAKPGERQDSWLLFKKRDRHARAQGGADVLSALPDSVISRPLKAGPMTAGSSDRPTGAVKATLPARLAPQLASLALAAPTSSAWSWEIKFDGYRLMARIEGGQARLITRGGHDWSARMPALVTALQGLPVHSAWLDGELVLLNDRGTPDFGALQNAFDGAHTDALDYFLFDLPYLNGLDLRATPLVQRRQLLRQLLEAHPPTHTHPHPNPHPHLRFSADFDADAASILESARRMGLEGVIAKRKDAPYESRRTETWLKLKHTQRQAFVIAGYTDRASGEAEIGSLLLGVHDDSGRLVPVGKVGTGWNAGTATALKTRLAKIEVPVSPFEAAPPLAPRRAVRDRGVRHHVQPVLVADIEFSGWTAGRQLRHARFLALRSDKAPASVTHENAVMPPGPALRLGAARSVIGGVKVSHPERIIDTSTGITKRELVHYYEAVAARMLPHLKGRPCSLVRGPSGVGGALFFQKHIESLQIPGVRALDAGLWPGHAPLLELRSKQGLIGAAQMNVIEVHTWNAAVRRIDRPDRVIFDLDPGEGEAWARVQQAAELVRGLLQALGLQSWLKTSGGKGLHVVVPIVPDPQGDWDTVKAFSQAVVQHLARVIPQRFTARMGAPNRVGKLYVDYLRNHHGATTAAAFSARARPGLGVSMPLAWEWLPSLQRSDQWTVRTALEHLSRESTDPWSDYWTCQQTLAPALGQLGVPDHSAPGKKKQTPAPHGAR